MDGPSLVVEFRALGNNSREHVKNIFSCFVYREFTKNDPNRPTVICFPTECIINNSASTPRAHQAVKRSTDQADAKYSNKKEKNLE